MARWTLAAGCLMVVAACANSAPPAAEPVVDGSRPEPGATVALQCQPSDRMPLEGRASPYDSARIAVGDRQILACYGRPGVKGREIFGALIPYGELWRTGANEPTILHVPFAAEIAGVRVAPGSYSLYTIPQEDRWTIILNPSTSQWGHENSYTAEIQAQEVGRGMASTERLDQHVELFTIRGDGGDILLEWERTRVRIPVRPL